MSAILSRPTFLTTVDGILQSQAHFTHRRITIGSPNTRVGLILSFGFICLSSQIMIINRNIVPGDPISQAVWVRFSIVILIMWFSEVWVNICVRRHAVSPLSWICPRVCFLVWRGVYYGTSSICCVLTIGSTTVKILIVNIRTFVSLRLSLAIALVPNWWHAIGLFRMLHQCIILIETALFPSVRNTRTCVNAWVTWQPCQRCFTPSRSWVCSDTGHFLIFLGADVRFRVVSKQSAMGTGGIDLSLDTLQLQLQFFLQMYMVGFKCIEKMIECIWISTLLDILVQAVNIKKL